MNTYLNAPELNETNQTDVVKGEIEVTGKDGKPRKEIAVSHKKIPGLCVTSCNVYGEFDITHRPSSMTICRGFERMWEAFLHMAQLQKQAIENGFDWDLEKEEFLAQEGLKSSGVVAELNHTTFDNTNCQFPWEDQHPCDKALELIDSLEADAT